METLHLRPTGQKKELGESFRELLGPLSLLEIATNRELGPLASTVLSRLTCEQGRSR
jgi:hypothetical protein